jgi:hypothetical protein
MHRLLYPRPRYTYTACEAPVMTPGFHFFEALRVIVAFCSCLTPVCSSLYAQEATKKPTERSAEETKPAAEPENPAQIDLLETRIRFEANGDSRKEVHTRVKINNELGARQFARLNFGYNRAFESVELPLVHITHANGGSADILPSAISDQPNPAVVNAPAYQDVRVKSVRILGLEPGDQLEYRVITTVTHHPLAPDFWFQHTFDRTGIVLREDLTLELPPGRGYAQDNSQMPSELTTGPGGGYTYHWQRKQEAADSLRAEEPERAPDITAGTLATEVELAVRLANFFYSHTGSSPVIAAKARELTEGSKNDEERLRALYAFVSKSIATVDLPIGATGYRTRTPEEILKSGTATPEDKASLLIALVAGVANFQPAVCFAPQHNWPPPYYSLIIEIQHLLLGVPEGVLGKPIWLDPALEVVPFGMISSTYRGKTVLCLPQSELDQGLSFGEQVPEEIPFAASQQVNVDASLSSDGTLTSKVHYVLRGDNELLLRLAFHQTPKERWKEVAQLLAFSDGFRGKITNVEASDPYDTKEPLTVNYEISQSKFVDWSKKPVRIPALLPQIGLPDVPAKSTSNAAPAPIELGTPLEVEARAVLHLPSGTMARAPIGVAVSRDYATFVSQYSASAETVTAKRRVNFVLRELPAGRTVDYNSFRRAVQNDEAQDFTLERPEAGPTKTNSAAPAHPAPPKTNPPKP